MTTVASRLTDAEVSTLDRYFDTRPVAEEAAARTAQTVLRPDLNGLLMKSPKSTNIYLIDNGYRRLVPPAAMKQLFIPNAQVFSTIELVGVTVGVPVNPQAVLIVAPGSVAQYIVDCGPNTAAVTKRLIPSPTIKTDYQFTEALTVVPPLVAATLPTGPSFDAPSGI